MRDSINEVKMAVVKIVCSDINHCGSGFIVSKEGYIITCHHIVFDAKKQKYSENINIIFSDGSNKEAIILEPKNVNSNDMQRNYDYAIIKIEGNNFDYLNLGDYNSAEEGDEIYFCGYPFGINNHTTHIGIISSKYIYEDEHLSVTPNVFQIDGSINKGNSGGPLILKKTNEVIGIISMRFGGITDKLNEVRNRILQNQDPNRPVKITHTMDGVEPLDTILDLINTMDNFISTGTGIAISIEYLKENYNKIIKI